MKIAILNECFFDESHIHRLKKIGKVKIYPNTTKEIDVIDRLKDVDIGIVDMFTAPITAKSLDSCKRLKLLALNSTGFDKVNREHARKLGISISNVPGFSTDSVAEQVMSLMFAVNRKITIGDRDFRKSLLEIDPGNKTHMKYLGMNIRGKTMGVIGCGNIGSRVIQLARGLGMEVLAYNRTRKKIHGAKFVSLKQLLGNSDVISVNLALNMETERLIGNKEFKLMKSHAIFINASRGKIVDTQALFSALKNGKIGGAGLDTVDGIEKNHPILKMEHVVFSPHSGWFTRESLDNIAESIVHTVESFSAGKPIKIVN